jgi:hypothetical protein
MEPVILTDFEVEIPPAEVRRLLGHTGGSRAEPGMAEAGGEAGHGVRIPGERLERAVEDAIARAHELLRTAGVYVVGSGDDLQGSTVFEGLERVAYCVCTIGSPLEEEVTRLSGEDELLGAVVLDAAGSVAAEAAAEYMDGRIREEAAGLGLKTSCRASPGYGDWDVREQSKIFRIVPAERIGVTLSESSMMIPRKSVSFAIHIDERPKRLRSENSCRNCDRTDCPYRLLE